MNMFKRILSWMHTYTQPKMENPARTSMKKVRSIKNKPRIKGAFSRKVLRFQRRLNKGYHPGQLGVSNVTKRIKAQYGTFMTRRERKRLAKATKMPFHLFYNYPTQFRSKGRKAQ